MMVTSGFSNTTSQVTTLYYKNHKDLFMMQNKRESHFYKAPLYQNNQLSKRTYVLDREDTSCPQTKLAPCWSHYQSLLEQHGFRLETARDVKAWYQEACQGTTADYRTMPGYIRACAVVDETILYKDTSLVSCLETSVWDDWMKLLLQPDYLFRGIRLRGHANVIIKAVHGRSNEFTNLQFLSLPRMKEHRNNHTIRAFMIYVDTFAIRSTCWQIYALSLMEVTGLALSLWRKPQQVGQLL